MIRRMREDELNLLADFIVDQFYEREQLQLMLQGIEPPKAKQFAAVFLSNQISYLYKYGDVFVTGPPLSGTIMGIAGRKKTFWGKVPSLLRANKALKMLTPKERKRFISNAKSVQETHQTRWFKRHGHKKPYDLSILAVAKEARGKGLCRELMEHLFRHVQPLNAAIAVLTNTKGNVPIYEHFGFHLVEAKEAKNKSITEYRMIKEEINGNRTH